MSSRLASARHAAVLFAVFGVLAFAVIPTPASRPSALVAVGTADLLVAAMAWTLPWRRWPDWCTLLLAAPGFGIIAASNTAGLVPPRSYSVLFVLVFVWVGSYHARWSSLAVAPVAALAYTAGIQANPRGVPVDPRAVVMTTAVCVLVAETVAHAQARLRRSEAELYRLATRDALTGLPNRAELSRRLDDLLEARSAVAVAFIDLDGFKAINDRNGHAAGDAVLVEVARRLTAVTRPVDMVARYGGDEFVVAIAGLTVEEEVLGLAARIERELARPYRVDQDWASLAASVGVSFAGPRLCAEELIAAADASMYTTKHARRSSAPVLLPTQREPGAQEPRCAAPKQG